LRNIKIVLEYDGTNFYGWQVQPARRTVQGELEYSIEKFLGEHFRVIAGGRTDTGVHAIGQVANFHTDSDYDTETIKNALNANLPPDILIKEVEEVEESFHSRFDAKSRLYIYRIAKYPSVFSRFFSWHFRYPLNVKLMNRSCELMLGEKDLTSFTVTKSKKGNMVVNIMNCVFTENNKEIIFSIKADRFLHKCVRTIIGTLIDINKNGVPERIIDIISARDRKKAGETVPPHGLFLRQVNYGTSRSRYGKK
jgi:tRNA pseudouridine38-40 synthase